MPETLKDCKCLDAEDKEFLIEALNDAIGYNAFRYRKAMENHQKIDSEAYRVRRLAFDELREVVKNTPECI